MPTFRERLSSLWGSPAPRPQPNRPDLETQLVRLEQKYRESVDYFNQLVSPLEMWGLDGGDFSAWSIPGGAGFNTGRVGGREFPVWWTETQLNGFREASRILHRLNDFAAGQSKRLSEYTCGKGFAWQACRRGIRKGAAPGAGGAADPDVLAWQEVADEFRDRDEWDERRLQNVYRWHEDGEICVRLFRGEDVPECRQVEPEYIGAPPGFTDSQGQWSFGILTPRGDVECRIAAYLRDPRTPDDGFVVPFAGVTPRRLRQVMDQAGADRLRVGEGVLCFLTNNVKRTQKRGVPTSLASREMLETSRKLLIKSLQTAAIQAAIALIRTHPGATPQTVQNFTNAITGGATVPGRAGPPGVGGSPRPVPFAWSGPGSMVIDTTDATNYAAGPVSTGAPALLQVEQAGLRGAGARTATPEFMISGDASNGNYASIKEAGSPWVVARETEQWVVAGFERRVAREICRLACESGHLRADHERLDTEVIPPPVAMKSDLEAAQVEDIKIRNKTLSPQEAIQRDNRDPKHTVADLKAWQEEFPDQGQPLEMPGMGGGDGGLAEGTYGTDAIGRRYRLHRAGGPSPLGESFLKGRLTESAGRLMSWTGIGLTGLAADLQRRLAAVVDPADLADDGKEDNPHITARYGLHTQDPAAVARVVAGFGPVRYTLTGASAFFGADTGKPYDVLLLAVDSPDLVRLNALLGELAHTDTWDEYQPHATVAYLRAGSARKYLYEFGGLSPVSGEATELEFSDAGKTRTVLPLTGAAAEGRRVHEVKDDEGHEHGADGKFTGTGGSGGAGDAAEHKAHVEHLTATLDNHPGRRHVGIFANPNPEQKRQAAAYLALDHARDVLAKGDGPAPGKTPVGSLKNALGELAAADQSSRTVLAFRAAQAGGHLSDKDRAAIAAAQAKMPQQAARAAEAAHEHLKTVLATLPPAKRVTVPAGDVAKAQVVDLSKITDPHVRGIVETLAGGTDTAATFGLGKDVRVVVPTKDQQKLWRLVANQGVGLPELQSANKSAGDLWDKSAAPTQVRTADVPPEARGRAASRRQHDDQRKAIDEVPQYKRLSDDAYLARVPKGLGATYKVMPKSAVPPDVIGIPAWAARDEAPPAATGYRG